MLSTIKLAGDLDERFDEIKNLLADQLGYEPTNEEVVGILMDEYTSQRSSSPAGVREEQTSVMED